MKNDLGKNGVAIMAIFIWVGFVGAISFMEAWIKFQAPGVTLEIGLGIGRLVFGALNKVEWILFLIGVMACMYPFINQKIKPKVVWLPISLGIILLVQSAFLLPALDRRALDLIAGNTVPDSYHHLTYIVLEMVKMILLVGWGLQLFKGRSD